MRKSIAITTTLLSFFFIINGVFAMTPRLKFPSWHKTEIKLSDWDPSNEQLTLTVNIEASRIPITTAYSQPYIQSQFDVLQKKQEKSDIKQGSKITFTHLLNLKSNTENWLEMDVRAMPDIAGLKILIRDEMKNNPTMSEILEAEANQIKSPIFIGTSMPLLLRDDIALAVTPEIAFTPTFNHNGNDYYIWLPLDSAENQTTNSAIKLFRDAVAEKDLKKIEATGLNLVKRFDTGKKSILFKRKNGDNFMIPTNIAIEMIKADLSCTKAILSQKTEILENTFKSAKQSYSKAFLAFNLALLFKTQNNSQKANYYFKEALKEQQAWPLAKKHIANN